jgi:hypothetical protein
VRELTNSKIDQADTQAIIFALSYFRQLSITAKSMHALRAHEEHDSLLARVRAPLGLKFPQPSRQARAWRGIVLHLAAIQERKPLEQMHVLLVLQ